MKRRELQLVGLLAGGVVTSMAAAMLIRAAGYPASMGGIVRGDRLDRIRRSPQWDARKGMFVNTETTSVIVPGKELDTARAWLRKPSGSVPSEDVPTVRPRFTDPLEQGLRLTWLGHSTVLLQIDGTRVLIDPLFAERASPVTLMGPKRFHPAPLCAADLPELDAIAISHDHYDHLDMATVQALARHSDVPFIVPLGVGAHLERWGIPQQRIVELDWWEEVQIGELTLASTPARHFSGRGLLNRCSTLWTSWTFIGRRHRVFFSGDTGFFGGFTDISKAYGPFDLAMIEIGAYHPHWGQIHMGPQNAIRAFEMLEANFLVPIHWGTFDLGVHEWRDPIRTFVDLARERNVRWAAPMPGASVEPGVEEPREPWWE
jgi:L-ascorbate metabolism protein UlaG (beta-lactamase superfamily)